MANTEPSCTSSSSRNSVPERESTGVRGQRFQKWTEVLQARPRKPTLFSASSGNGFEVGESSLHGEARDVKLAKLRSDVNTACRVTFKETGRYLNPEGRRCEVERLPFCTTEEIWEWGTPTAMVLLMRSFLCCSGAMLILFAVSFPQLLDNRGRNQLRNKCRKSPFKQLVRGGGDDGGGGGEKDAVGEKDAEDLVEACGYADLPIRKTIAQVDWSLWYAAGTCQEYTRDTNSTQYSPFQSSRNYPFVALPSSKFCAFTNVFEASHWLSLIGATLTIIGLLLWMRRRQRMLWMAKHRDIHSAGVACASHMHHTTRMSHVPPCMHHTMHVHVHVYAHACMH